MSDEHTEALDKGDLSMISFGDAAKRVVEKVKPQGIEPTTADIGRGVIYRADSRLPGERETGVITSVTPHAVFVRYGAERNSKATSACDLTWEFPR